MKDFQNIYVLALQAQFAAALRELVRQEAQASSDFESINITVLADGDIDVQICSAGGCLEGYSL